MSKKELMIKELQELHQEGLQVGDELKEKKDAEFRYKYQLWYTKALKVVELLMPDRYAEFRSYYEVDPKRKRLGAGKYVIQDYFKGVQPYLPNYSKSNAYTETLLCFSNQLTVFTSIESRINSLLCNVEDELYAGLQDNEIIIAKQLIKVSPRAAGALIGVVIESHLQKVAIRHQDKLPKLSKKNPTISDLNDPLKNANVIDTPTWRKITYLGDIRNLCSHKKDIEPTVEQIKELIEGADWLIKNVF